MVLGSSHAPLLPPAVQCRKETCLNNRKTSGSPRGPLVSSPPGAPGLGVDDDLDAAVGLFLEHLVGVPAIFQLDLVGDQEVGVALVSSRPFSHWEKVPRRGG